MQSQYAPYNHFFVKRNQQQQPNSEENIYNYNNCRGIIEKKKQKKYNFRESIYL
jgi:hypothetical protein